jgi:hypothetical protein
MRILLTTIVLFIASGVARGGVISVSNPGFERRVLSTPGSYALFDVPDWSITGQVGTFRPGTFNFPAGVPEGVNVAAIGNNSGGGTLEQTLAATLSSNTKYSLMVDVGRRLDYPFSAYSIELLAGGVAIASSSVLNPLAGTFQSEELIFTTGSTHAHLGQTLGIRLTGSTARAQVNFDNVRLNAINANAVPEPSTLAFGFFAAGTLLMRRRR